jgi:ketosteroid isomerase-like protein
MRYAVTIAALVLTLGVGACAGPKQQEFTRADAEAIKKGTADFAAAFNNKELDKVIEFYMDSSVLMPPNKPLLRGRDTLKAFYGGEVARGGELSMEVEEVQGHGPLAYESGTYAITFAGGARDRGKYLRVLRQMGGTWRTEKTIWSSDLPQQGAAAD